MYFSLAASAQITDAFYVVTAQWLPLDKGYVVDLEARIDSGNHWFVAGFTAYSNWRNEVDMPQYIKGYGMLLQHKIYIGLENFYCFYGINYHTQELYFNAMDTVFRENNGVRTTSFEKVTFVLPLQRIGADFAIGYQNALFKKRPIPVLDVFVGMGYRHFNTKTGVAIPAQLPENTLKKISGLHGLGGIKLGFMF